MGADMLAGRILFKKGVVCTRQRSCSYELKYRRRRLCTVRRTYDVCKQASTYINITYIIVINKNRFQKP
jgi:hypothetical protein